MSNSHLYIKAGYPRAVLGNGLGRYVCQLQRLTIKFCKSSGSSRGIRDFIETELIDFAKSNPGIVVYCKPRRHRTPVFVAEYLNGERKWMPATNLTKEEVSRWINHFKNTSGRPEMRLCKYWHTDNPSIQGPWNPFLNRNPELNLAELPNEKYSLPKNITPSATEILIELFKKQQIEEKGTSKEEN